MAVYGGSFIATGDHLEFVLDALNGTNVCDNNQFYEPAVIVQQMYKGNKRIQSDGLRGVIADSSPIDATVVILQEQNGLLIEVARTSSADGSWSFTNLADAKSHAIAFRETFNAGITSNLQPED